MSNIRESRRMIPVLQLLILLVSALWFASASRGNAQAACSADYDSLSILGVGKSTDETVLESVEAWKLDGSRYEEAIGRPIASAQIETDGTKAGRCYLLVYESRADADAVVVFTYSFQRLFETRGDLHNHADGNSGTLPRADYDALIAVLNGLAGTPAST